MPIEKAKLKGKQERVENIDLRKTQKGPLAVKPPNEIALVGRSVSESEPRQQ